ncbi:hypothetical protein [Methanoculleus caldifontis]|uniref:hypothetical protein n=1 Tax=Methanoculleus caldifontis TaxID=2651577 RepID=UPI0029374442|nr:hypothetical protein [Methanoculleus sp. Wushi-C6]
MILIGYPLSWQGHTEKVAAALVRRIERRQGGVMAFFGMRAAIDPVTTDLPASTS